LHVLQPSDAQEALDSSIALFCIATCSQLNVNKSHGFLVQAQPLASASVAALPSIIFITGSFITNHQASWGSLGLRHAGSLSSTIQRHLSCHQRQGQALGSSGPFISGQVHVAKKLLAASLWYHASFQRPSEQLLQQLSQQLRKFVASAQQANHSDDAVALA